MRKINENENENVVKKVKRILEFKFFSDDKKSDLIADLIAKSEKPKTIKSVVKRAGRPTLNAITLAFISRVKGATIPEVVEEGLRLYPEKTKKTITKTTIRRLRGEITLPENTEIVDEGDGELSIYYLRKTEKSENEKSPILLP